MNSESRSYYAASIHSIWAVHFTQHLEPESFFGLLNDLTVRLKEATYILQNAAPTTTGALRKYQQL
jgi:hypothetical protein